VKCEHDHVEGRLTPNRFSRLAHRFAHSECECITRHPDPCCHRDQCAASTFRTAVYNTQVSGPFNAGSGLSIARSASKELDGARLRSAAASSQWWCLRLCKRPIMQEVRAHFSFQAACGHLKCPCVCGREVCHRTVQSKLGVRNNRSPLTI
jgi:hypothetical protein